MSLPQPERCRNSAPHTGSSHHEQQATDGEPPDHATPAFSWFHKTTPGIAPAAPGRTVPPLGRGDDHATRGALHLVRPAPEPEMPAAPTTGPQPVRHLTWDEIQYFIDHDPDMFDEDLHRFAQWDMAIDAEPEIE